MKEQQQLEEKNFFTPNNHYTTEFQNDEQKDKPQMNSLKISNGW